MGYGVAGTALSLRGTPYRNGGSDPAGFDCSGFVSTSSARTASRVPRTVTEQFRAGRQVGGAQLEPGDLVFFSTVSPGASHVGIAIGGDEFVHAPSGTGEVRVERMSASVLGYAVCWSAKGSLTSRRAAASVNWRTCRSLSV